MMKQGLYQTRSNYFVGGTATNALFVVLSCLQISLKKGKNILIFILLKCCKVKNQVTTTEVLYHNRGLPREAILEAAVGKKRNRNHLQLLANMYQSTHSLLKQTRTFESHNVFKIYLFSENNDKSIHVQQHTQCDIGECGSILYTCIVCM